MLDMQAVLRVLRMLLAEILTTSRKHFQAMPAFAEDDDSSSGSDDEQQPSSPSPTDEPSSHSAPGMHPELQMHIDLAHNRSSAPEALLSPSASSPPAIIARAGSHASSRSAGSRPESPGSAPMTIRTRARSHSSSPPGRISTVRPGFATLGQSPTPEVLAERRSSRRHADHLPSTAEELDAEGHESAPQGAARAESAPHESAPAGSAFNSSDQTGDDGTIITTAQSAPQSNEFTAEAQLVSAHQQQAGLPFPDLFSEDLELDTTPSAPAQKAHDRAALSPSPSAAALLAASGLSRSSTPRRSSTGVGLAALLGGSPFPLFTGEPFAGMLAILGRTSLNHLSAPPALTNCMPSKVCSDRCCIMSQQNVGRHYCLLPSTSR